jgi:flagellum-specific peptidoglycan hydrolase FlgJ
MIQIQELIKHFVLGIASLIICSITMAEIKNTKDFMKAIDEVAEEYPEGSIERKLLKKRGFVASVSALETGNFQFPGAPTAQKGNNFFGLKPMGDQDFITTTGGVNIASFPDPKSSIRGFANLITTDDRYSEVVKAAEQDEPISNMFQGMTAYAENPNYVNLLNSVYNDRIKPIIETENMLVPRRKPMMNQMNTLK